MNLCLLMKTTALLYSLRKMATLTGRQILLFRKIQKSVIANGVTRSMAGVKPWNYLWKPGPYPETEEGMSHQM